jgi:hypothetical protein
MILLWKEATARTRIFVALNIIAVITGGLAIDAVFKWPGQIAAVIWTFLVWAWLYKIAGLEERRVMILATAIAGFGEVILSLVWGIYDYQFQNVPLFVPPGHALLMTLGLLASRYFSLRAAWTIAALASAWAVYAWVAGFDRFGVVLHGVFIICMFTGRAKSLYATMYVLALTMELYGTALGNWQWRATAPWLGLSAANPPFSAGAFYALLDLLVLAALKAWPVRVPRVAQNTKL